MKNKFLNKKNYEKEVWFRNFRSRGTGTLIDGREGRKSVEIVLAIYESAQSGKMVRLPESGNSI